jgi:integrase
MGTRSTPTIQEAVSQYLDSREDDLGVRSLAGERGLLARFVKWCPDKQVGRLTAEDFEGFVRALRRGDPKICKRPNGAAAVTLARGRLKGFLAYLSRKGWCRGDLLDGVRAPKRGARRDFLRLSADELLTMLDTAEHPRDRAMLAMGMNTGLRANELTAIRLGAIDLEAGEFFTTITKTADTDYMPITADLDAELRLWLTYYQQACGPLQGHWYAFPAKEAHHYRGQAGWRVLEAGKLKPEAPCSNPHRIARRALLSLGYPEDRLQQEGFHTLRRSVARLYFDQVSASGYDGALRQTSALLHHRSSRTTELYLGLDMERDKRDNRLKGQVFLTGMRSQADNVRELGHG